MMVPFLQRDNNVTKSKFIRTTVNTLLKRKQVLANVFLMCTLTGRERGEKKKQRDRDSEKEIGAGDKRRKRETQGH